MAVAVNHKETFAREILLAFEQRPCSSHNSICKPKPHHYSTNVLLRRNQQLGLEEALILWQFGKTQKTYQLSYGTTGWRHWLPSYAIVSRSFGQVSLSSTSSA